jgi:medium-chain acyl-[acyl-carrier-protein] hydrolase
VDAVAGRIGSEIDVPYVLYGHSMGGLISFELARELVRRYSRGPRHLFVSAYRAPDLTDERPATFNLPHREFIAELKRLKGTPAQILENPELMEVFMPVLRADFQVVETYEYCPQARLRCPITVYSGRDDERVLLEGVYGWEAQTSAPCTVRLLPGDHFFIHAGQEFTTTFRNDVLGVLRALVL